MSSIDQLYHWLEARGKVKSIAGIYMLRLDIRLLQAGMEKWPRDKLCFLWRAQWAEMKESVNDALFYVPQALMRTFRDALAQPTTTRNLHWLNMNEPFHEHVWLEFDINHPANSDK